MRDAYMVHAGCMRRARGLEREHGQRGACGQREHGEKEYGERAWGEGALEEALGEREHWEREHWERELRRESVGRGGEGAWRGEGAWGGGALGDRERGVRGSVFQMWGL